MLVFVDLSFTVRTLALAVFPCTSLKGISLVLLVFVGLRHLLFCCSTQWVCAAPRGQHLGLLFSLLGQLLLVGQQQLASTFLGQQEHLRLSS